jgi:hypothetical protein
LGGVAKSNGSRGHTGCGLAVLAHGPRGQAGLFFIATAVAGAACACDFATNPCARTERILQRREFDTIGRRGGSGEPDACSSRTACNDASVPLTDNERAAFATLDTSACARGLLRPKTQAGSGRMGSGDGVHALRGFTGPLRRR